MSEISREKYIDGLITQHGVTHDNAERMAALKFGARPAAKTRLADEDVRLVMSVVLPLHLVLPWSALCSDNDKYVPAMRGSRPVMILTEQYRAAKQKARAIGIEAMKIEGARAEPFAKPLALTARVWVPDNRPGHDVANFAKCAHDALERVVYTKDEWLHDSRWTRAGVDVDHPRAELTITPVIAPALDVHSISRETR